MTTMGDEKMNEINKICFDLNYIFKNKNVQSSNLSKPRPKN